MTRRRADLSGNGLTFPSPGKGNKKTGRPNIIKIFRQPGCLMETLLAFRPILANGLVLSNISSLCTAVTIGLLAIMYSKSSSNNCLN